jgi:hypothetical protein
MLFGSGLILAAVLGSIAASHASGRAPSDPWAPPPTVRPIIPRSAPLPSVDLTLRMHQDKFDLKSLIPKHPPIEVKSMKVVGASGFSVYFPAASDVAAGFGVTAFKLQPGKRALQGVIGLRFKF